LHWFQVLPLYREANRDLLFTDGLDNHSSGNRFGYDPDVALVAPVSADVGCDGTGTWQPARFGAGHVPFTCLAMTI
jgi:hypothetical protein